MAAVALWIFTSFTTSNSEEYGRTLAFAALVAMQWTSALCYRSDYTPLWRRILTPNPAFYIGLVIAVGLQAFALFGPLAPWLHVRDVAIGDLAYVLGIALIVPVIAIELHKFVGRRFFDKGDKLA